MLQPRRYRIQLEWYRLLGLQVVGLDLDIGFVSLGFVLVSDRFGSVWTWFGLVLVWCQVVFGFCMDSDVKYKLIRFENTFFN